MSYGGYNTKKWKKKGDTHQEAKAKAAEPEEPAGPSYGQETMLRLFEVLKKKGIPDQFQLGFATESRPAEAEAGGEDATAAREALREELKNRKLAKRQASGSVSGATPTAAPTLPAAAFPPAGGGTFAMPQPVSPMNAAMMWNPLMSPMAAAQAQAPMAMQYCCPLWGTEATVRLTNVPSGYKQETLAALLGVRFRGAIDFLFLPIPREGSAEGAHNCGHAFVNFRHPQAVNDFKTAFNNVRAGTAFPGSRPAAAAAAAAPTAAEQSAETAEAPTAVEKSAETAEAEPAAEGGDSPKDGEAPKVNETSKSAADKQCKVQKAKIGTLDKLIAEVRIQASSGQSIRMPILWDLWGNVRPIPTADRYSAAAAAASAATAAAMSAAAFSGSSYGPAIRQQIEYYFSFDNMCRDVYLRQNMDSEGWVPMTLIASFNKIKQYGVPPDTLGTYVANSTVVEVDEEKKRLRQRDAEQRMIWELKGNLDGQSQAPVKKDSEVIELKGEEVTA